MDDIKKETKRAGMIETVVGVATVALGSDTEVPVFVAPCDGKIKEVGFVPKAAITGADTNYFTLGFKNKGAAGTGTDVIAEKAYTDGIDVAAFDHEDLGTVANNLLSEGDVVSFHKTETGNGMAMPDLIAVVVFQPYWKKWQI